MTRIVSCVRQALDWNLSTKDFRIDRQTHEPVVAFARYRIDQFDEIAVEVALQAKQKAGAAVHAVSAGTKGSEDVLKHAIAMGADSATLVDVDAAGAAEIDAPALLAAAVRELGGADIVLCGRTGSERGTATTGPLLAELLGLPLITNVVRIERDEGGWICQREEGGGYERVRVGGACVATVTNAPFNVPRVLTLKDKMHAHRQQIEIVPAQEIAQNTQYRPCRVTQIELMHRYVPQLSRQCRRLTGELSEQARVVAEYIASAVEPQR